ncbi:MAG: HAD family hydrolase [Spirochaetia bacterium]|jgi:phosphoglycolate phosphatase|nr:HAD family hydrolase [Spirochaetia bacterium]
MKYKAVIFDLDGTLIETANDIGFYINLILKRHSFPEISLDNVSSIVGWGLKSAMEKALAGAEPDSGKIEKYTNELIEEYALNPVIDTYIYDGINELLDIVNKKGLKSAVYSNKAHPVTVRIVDILFPSGQFEIVRGAVEGFPKKPNPDGALLIANSLGCKPQEILYIGDSDVDCLTAKNGGFDFVAALWGYRSKEQLEKAGAARFASKPSALADFLI